MRMAGYGGVRCNGKNRFPVTKNPRVASNAAFSTEYPVRIRKRETKGFRGVRFGKGSRPAPRRMLRRIAATRAFQSSRVEAYESTAASLLLPVLEEVKGASSASWAQAFAVGAAEAAGCESRSNTSLESTPNCARSGASPQPSARTKSLA